MGPAPILDLVWSPDGKFLVSQTGGAGTLTWKIPSGKSLKWIDVSSCASWSPDGRRLAVGLRVYDTSIWEQIGSDHKLPDGNISGVCWLSDNVRAAISTSEGRLYLRNMKNGEYVSLGPKRDAAVYGLAISPDGKRLACTSSNTTDVWDLVSLTLIKTGPGGGIIRWSPSGKTLAIATGSECAEWNPDSGVSRKSSLDGNTIFGIGWSPDGRTLAAAIENGQVQFIQADNWKPTGPLSKEWDSTGRTVCSPDGSLIATNAFATQETPRARLFTTSGDFIHEIQLSPGATGVSLGLSTDGALLASASAGIELIDCHLGLPVEWLDGDQTNFVVAWRRTLQQFRRCGMVT